ncbi:pentatricopeptide repeat-containing protein, mitochondrial-like protein [Cinnamomum micranthum f. kanehirae]|uniref:Pentatricopeptide repeat-containing protein, mitochondrial-like protein n=1 Tax=Cinnamomum micranthum f. kanehirae TaxID=337451 RepID=A0A443P892_9MAGN|nr:pentatricopeptide repeat-containing protein, mitochondrial-like protein [Cinnamomum micranthum f. kanehirae]
MNLMPLSAKLSHSLSPRKLYSIPSSTSKLNHASCRRWYLSKAHEKVQRPQLPPFCPDLQSAFLCDAEPWKQFLHRLHIGVVYKCLPNAFSYDYLVHGLCAQRRSMNAQELYGEMMTIGGEVNEAVRILWEMEEMKWAVDSITYQTVVVALGRQGRVEEVVRLLRQLRGKEMLDGQMYGKLMHLLLQEDFGESDGRNGFGER